MRLGTCTARCTVALPACIIPFFPFFPSLSLSENLPPLPLISLCLSIPDDFYPLVGNSMIPAVVPRSSLVLEYSTVQYYTCTDTSAVRIHVPSGWVPYSSLPASLSLVLPYKVCKEELFSCCSPRVLPFVHLNPGDTLLSPPLPLYPPRTILPLNLAVLGNPHLFGANHVQAPCCAAYDATKW